MPGPRKYQMRHNLSNEHSKGITTVAISPSGSLIATAGLDGRICWWGVETGELLYVWEGRCAVLSLAWMSDQENTVLCGLQDGNLAVLGVKENMLYVVGSWAHKYPVECIAMHGARIATGAHRELNVWRWDDRNRLSRIRTLAEPPRTYQNKEDEVVVTSLHWITQQSTLLLVTYLYQGVHFFDAETGERTRIFAIPGMIASASLSTDGANLAVSNIFRGFDIYKLETEALLASFNHLDESHQTFAAPVPVLFIHCGHAIVGGSVVGQVGIWDIYMGKMHTVTLPKTCKILSVDAHCNVDTGANRFLIATGILREEGMSECIIWEAEELPSAQNMDYDSDSNLNVESRYNGSVPSTKGSSVLRGRVIWGGVSLLAVLYAVNTLLLWLNPT